MSRAVGPRVLIMLTSSARRGAEIEGFRVAQELSARGLATEAIALCDPGGDTERLPVRSLGSRPLGVGTLRALRRLAQGCDLVVAFGSTTLSACALGLAGTRVRWVYRSIGDPAAWAGGAARRWRTAVQMRRAESVVAIWPGAAEWIRHNYRVRRIATIPNARSAQEFTPVTDTERDAAKLDFFANTDRTVALVGALSEEKRPELAVKVAAGLGNTNLLVAGDGPLRHDVEALATRLAPNRVRFLGSVGDPRSVYAACDALLLTSRTEGMPGVAIEALMCGVGVAASRVGAIESMHGDIQLVDPDAPVATWIEGTEKAAASHPDPLSMARFDWSDVGDAWFRLLTGHDTTTGAC